MLWVYFLGRRWWGETAAWGAALLLAVNVTVVDNAHSILNDPLMLCLMLWAVWECDGIRREGGLWRYARAGLAVGDRFEGPAVVEEEASTLIIGLGASGVVDARGWILVTLDGGRP